MRYVIATAALLLAFNAAPAQEDANQPATSDANVPSDLQTFEQRVSYTIGYNVGRNFAGNTISLDKELIIEGLVDGMGGADAELTPNQMRAVVMELQQRMQRALADRNKAESAQFLADNRKREGVNVTGSGLQYEVIEEGDGESPSATDQVTVHYRGTLPDGTVFDSSMQRGEPATFPLSNVIPGWTEGLQLMKEGATYNLYVPSDLAYGEQGPGRGPIGPNQALVFEVKLLKVTKAGDDASPGHDHTGHDHDGHDHDGHDDGGDH